MSWGNPESAGEKLITTLLMPASFAYGAASYARLCAYNLGVIRQQEVAATVISIGNITCGGTGKTPITIALAQQLASTGKRVAVLSRGYKRTSKEKFLIVSDGTKLTASCAESGDEPYLVASSVPSAVVIVGAKRTQTAGIAVDQFHCDTLLLDDGFQHVALKRNLDVVLLDYNDELSNDQLLPAGRLREPVSALARADWVIITKLPANPDEDRLASMRTLIRRYSTKAEISLSTMIADSLIQCCSSGSGGSTGLDGSTGSSGAVTPPSSLHGTKILAFAGIARPHSLTQQLKKLGADIVGEKYFPDHHWYTETDFLALRKKFESSGAKLIVTTEKDSVKLPPALVKDLPVVALRQRVEWLGAAPSFFSKPLLS